VFNWIHQQLVANPRESNIAVWYKVLSITTVAYFHNKTVQVIQAAHAQEQSGQAESKKKK
jgi:hypothetical protein